MQQTNWAHDIPFLLIAIVLSLTLIVFKYGLPDRETVHHFFDLVNTKGGNILILTGMSLIFFAVGMRLVYWGVNMQIDSKLASDNALILTAMNWITGAAFGGAFGALLKTMVGEEPKEKPKTPETPHDGSDRTGPVPPPNH